VAFFICFSRQQSVLYVTNNTPPVKGYFRLKTLLFDVNMFYNATKAYLRNNKVTKMTLGEKILRLRKEKKWSQKKLAAMIGTSGPVLGRYERDEITPSVEVAKKLAEAFGVTLDYLVDETGTVAEVTDREMLNRITEIDHLDREDKNTILRVVDSLLRDAKAKKAYGV
jgi:transcriptional regulator with XRE-family HTH domain